MMFAMPQPYRMIMWPVKRIYVFALEGPSPPPPGKKRSILCVGSPEAAGGVIVDVSLRRAQRDAVTQWNQDFFSQYRQSLFGQLLLQVVSGRQVPKDACTHNVVLSNKITVSARSRSPGSGYLWWSSWARRQVHSRCWRDAWFRPRPPVTPCFRRFHRLDFGWLQWHSVGQLCFHWRRAPPELGFLAELGPEFQRDHYLVHGYRQEVDRRGLV